MKKILLLSLGAVMVFSVTAQDNPKPTKKKDKPNLANRANDHFMLQLGYTGWAGKPDTINTGGFSKSINAYFMYDFPFKTNPNLSMAFGPGIGSDHITFSKTHVGIKDATNTLYFTDQSDTNHFKKTKLATTYLEAPIEFRYSADPVTGKGLKLAIGVKIGTLLNAHTRNTKYENKDGGTINDYVMKESSKRFFNKTRLSGMARVGYGHFSLYGSYQFTPLIRDGFGPQVRPFSIGLTLSGL
ncbi:MAG: outer membrane beta-barrel protein [Chitinophagaceae bacterium]|nr:outer membrane beta-barrel protein [Chitinophagaceae bacterium]